MSDLKARSSEPGRNKYADQRRNKRRTSSSSSNNISKEIQTDPCKLHVACIPSVFDTDKLVSVFSEVSTPTSVFLSTNKGANFLWAFVWYDSPAEALVVLQKLHKAPPHQLSISFAINNQPKSNKNHSVNSKSGHSSEISHEPQFGSSVGSDEEWGDSGGIQRSSPFLPNDQVTQTSTKFNGVTSQCTKKRVPRIPKVKSIKPIQNNTCQQVATFGDLGERGKNRISNLQVPLKINYNKACAYVRERVFDENRHFMEGVESQSRCRLCGVGARFECFSCSLKYCRAKCADVDVHNVKCRGITPAMDASNVNGGAAIIHSHEFNGKPASVKKAPEQQLYNTESSQSPSDTDSSSSALNTSLCPLPLGSYSPVIVLVSLGGFHYWVIPKQLSNTMNQVMKELQIACSSDQVTFKPNLSEKCAVPYDKIWHRGEVIHVKGDKYLVRFIDFGNEEELGCEDIRKLPPSLEKIPPLAFKMSFVEGTSKDYCDLEAGESLVVKPVIKSGDSWFVNVEGQVEDKRSFSLTKESEVSVKALRAMPSGTCVPKLHSKRDYGVSPRHILFMIEDTMNFNFKLRVSRVISETEVTGTLIVSGLEQSSCLEIESELKMLLPEQRGSPPLGQLVCCITEDGLWARGYPIRLAPTKMALVDYAVIARLDSFCSLTGTVSEAPLAGIRCKVLRPGHTKQADLLWGRAVSLEKEGLRVNLEGLGDGLLMAWDPQADPGGLVTANLPSASQVFITEYVSPKELYVRSAAPEAVQALNSIMAQTATSTKNSAIDQPLLGQVLACLYEDDCFYRAQIIEQNGDSYTVVYIDYGNKSRVRKEDLRSLDVTVKLAPAMAVKVGLRGVEGFDSCKSLLDLSLDTKYTIHHEGDLSSVTLSDNKGSLNERVSIQCVVDVKSIGVKYVYWPEGQTIRIEMKSKLGCNKYHAVRLDDPHLEYVNTTLSQRLEKHANQFPVEYRHCPAAGEVVVVRRGDGQWWRGVCLKQRAGPGRCRVMLLDRGLDEEVSQSEVRPVKEELLRAAVVVRQCLVHGVPDQLPAHVDRALERFLVEAASLQAVVIDDCCQGRALIYLPALLAKASIIGIPPITPPLFL